MFRLTLNLGGRAIQSSNFDQDVVYIGRDPECEVPIDNLGISRRHASVEMSDGEYVLTDLKSHNGTYVQGRRIYHHNLSESDEFFIGKYSIAFENMDVEAPAAAPEQLKKMSAGMQDMTFRLDRDEIDRMMGSSSSAHVPRLSQIAPESEKRIVVLDRFYYLIGKDPKAAIRIGGWLTPPFVAALIRNDRWFHVVALTTRTPVKVNGLEVAETQLADGDIVEVGRRKFRFARS